LRTRLAYSKRLHEVDEERYQAVLAKLRRQTEDAAAWRDKCVSYFGTFAVTGGVGLIRGLPLNVGRPLMAAARPFSTTAGRLVQCE